MTSLEKLNLHFCMLHEAFVPHRAIPAVRDELVNLVVFSFPI